ncbi:hypothetical protein M0R19_07480 [Candidatus Pacearchaeota archaeon]|jgi:hypothetical protein|nr:hypothetical protein [bacterium]MCK9597002.1 hypothetical protein [Candidatus Pacearchaeota archaeon]
MFVAIEKVKFKELNDYIEKNSHRVNVNGNIIDIHGDWFIYFVNTSTGLYYVVNRYNIRHVRIDTLRNIVTIEKGYHPSTHKLSTIKNQVPVSSQIWMYKDDINKFANMILFDLLLFRPETSWDHQTYYIEGDTATFY